MKKTSLYKIGALCFTFLGAGTFMAFDDAQTDEEKVETAYQQLVTDFKMEQDQLCKTQALAAAQAQFAQMQNAGGESSQGGNDTPPAVSGGNGSSQSSNSSSNNNSSADQGGNDNTPPPPPPPKEEPKDAQKGRDGGAKTGDADSQKGRTGGTKTDDGKKTNADDQKRRGGKK